MDLNNILNPIVTPTTKCEVNFCTNSAKTNYLCLKHHRLYNVILYTKDKVLKKLNHISNCNKCYNNNCLNNRILLRMKTNLKNKKSIYFYYWSVFILSRHKMKCNNYKCNICTYFEDYI